MSEEDKKVTPDLDEGEDKTSETNEKKELNSETLFHQKKAAQEKLEKEKEKREALEAELNELKSKQEAKKEVPESKDSNENKESVLQEKIDAIEFTLKHKDLSSDAVSTAIKVAKMEGISKDEALEHPMVKAYIEKINEEAKTKEAVPTSTRSAVATDEEKKASEDALRRARETGSAEDWAKVLDKRINK